MFKPASLGIITRITAIDFTRGLVMVIMALDHARDLLHVSSLTQNPTDLDTTTPLLFFTRWITHLCAPIFVFLSGASAYLSIKNKGNLAQSRRFLVSRGLWLVVLEFTIITFGIWFDLQFRMFLFQVIAAIGLSFVVLGLLLKLRSRIIGLIGFIIVLTHNLVPLIPFGEGSVVKLVLSPLFGPNVFQISPQVTLVIAYPVVPWLGIMLLGFGCGSLFLIPAVKRNRLFLWIGFSCLLLFTGLRLGNLYGDPLPWAPQKNAVYTFLSFINVTKYPPSFLYDLVMLGIMFLLLGVAENFKNSFSRIISLYGKVPLFYYLLHWYVLHGIMLVMVFVQGFSWTDLVFGAFQFGRPQVGSGVGLAGVYLIWFLVVVALYPLCKWFAHYKAAHAQKEWLRFL